MNGGQKKKLIVVEGVGDWAKSQYAHSLEPLAKAGECEVIFFYSRDYAGTTGVSDKIVRRYIQTTLSNVAEFEEWAACLNSPPLSGNPKVLEDARRGIKPYAVFIVTPDEIHCDLAEIWLNRGAKYIFVEKPFDASSQRISSFIRGLRTPNNIWGFDHYLVRAHQFIQSKAYFDFLRFLGGRITDFKFHMLECQDRGMKERAPSLQKGLIFDMASHAPALMLPFGEPRTIRDLEVYAGYYEGADEFMSTSTLQI